MGAGGDPDERAARIRHASRIISHLAAGKRQPPLRAAKPTTSPAESGSGSESARENGDDDDRLDFDADLCAPGEADDGGESVRRQFLDAVAHLLSADDERTDRHAAAALREDEDLIEVAVARNDGFGGTGSTAYAETVGFLTRLERDLVTGTTPSLDPNRSSAPLCGVELSAIEYGREDLDRAIARLRGLLDGLPPAARARGNPESAAGRWAAFVRILNMHPRRRDSHREHMVHWARECVDAAGTRAMLREAFGPDVESRLWRDLKRVRRPIELCRLVRKTAVTWMAETSRSVRFRIVPLARSAAAAARTREGTDAYEAWERMGLPDGRRRELAAAAAAARDDSDDTAESTLHAEMQIVTYLDADDLQVSDRRYIGTSSAASCLLCHGFLSSLSHPIATRGQDGRCDASWAAPSSAESGPIYLGLQRLEELLVARIGRYVGPGSATPAGPSSATPDGPALSTVASAEVPETNGVDVAAAAAPTTAPAVAPAAPAATPAPTTPATTVLAAVPDPAPAPTTPAPAAAPTPSPVEAPSPLSPLASPPPSRPRLSDINSSSSSIRHKKNSARLSCVACNSRPARLCQKCQSCSYCSKECQRADWPSHRLLCRALTEQPARPSPAHRRAILFPPLQTRPCLIWLEPAADGAGSSRHMLDPHLGQDEGASPTLLRVAENPRRGRKVGGGSAGNHVLRIWYREGFLVDGSAMNLSVMHAIGLAETNYHAWKGPLVAMHCCEDDPRGASYRDMTLADYRDVLDGLLTYGGGGAPVREMDKTMEMKPARWPGSVLGVQLTCAGEMAARSGDMDMCYLPVEVGSGHPARCRYNDRGVVPPADPSPLSARLGMPLLLWKREWRGRDWTGAPTWNWGNQDAVALMACCDPAAPDWSWAPSYWSADLGSVLVVREDGLDLDPAELASMCRFVRERVGPLFDDTIGAGGSATRSREEVLAAITVENMMAHAGGAAVADPPPPQVGKSAT